MATNMRASMMARLGGDFNGKLVLVIGDNTKHGCRAVEAAGGLPLVIRLSQSEMNEVREKNGQRRMDDVDWEKWLKSQRDMVEKRVDALMLALTSEKGPGIYADWLRAAARFM